MKNLLYRGAILPLFISFCFSLSAQIYVDQSAASGGDGTSWGTAYDLLETALTGAASGDEIWVAEGSYSITVSAESSFEIPSGVKVYGGFIGNENQRQSRNWENNETILDGLLNLQTIVYFENSSTETTLDGFTIQNGLAEGVDPRGESGSGIFMLNASPSIVNCHIKNNKSDAQGGAIFIEGSFSRIANPTFENCIIEDNVSLSNGGALYGGGHNNGMCNPVFEKCTFKNNSSAEEGGAMFLNGVDGSVTSTFKKCDFDSNTANGNGGAIYTLATLGGEGNHIVVNSRFYRNKGFAAGGMYNHGGNGGDASPIVSNCTFYLNEPTAAPSGQGGALYNNAEGGGKSNTIVSNSIIYGNIGPFNTQVFKNVDSSPSILYSLVDADNCDDLNSDPGSTVTCGDGMIFNVDPLFQDVTIADLRLKNNSPAIDAGDEDDDNIGTEDLDCGQREINTIDMGAYEAPDQNLPVELADFNAFFDQDKVTLFWITISEENNASFTIERSSDGRTFENLFSVPGAGTTTVARSYKEYDYHPLPGSNYYRLKNTSYNGEVEYSPIRIVEMSTKKINAFPNPVEDHLTITFSDFKEDEAHFAIYNIHGKLVYQGATAIENEVSFISLPEIGSFVPGYYVIKINTSRNGQFSQRFQKIRD